jgi:hypothetical protein
MYKILCFIALVAALPLLNGCTKTLPANGATAVVKMANGWWVQASSLDAGPLPSAGTHSFLTTYNTASNAIDSLFVDDLGYLGNGYDFKTETTANYTAFTFTSSASFNFYQPDSVTIIKGQIFPKGGLSRSGVVTDSIYLQVSFSDIPGDVLTVAGVARTGFDQDDY